MNLESNNSTKYHKISKNWVGPRCRNARVIYNIGKKKYNINTTEENRLLLKKSSKDYKSTMNNFINKSKFQNETKLREMSRKKPKDYWKFLNSLKQKTSLKKTCPRRII